MLKHENNKMVFLKGDKGKSRMSTPTYISVEGEITPLDSFLVSGEDNDGKRVIMCQNVSLEDLMVYLKTLEVVINEKIKDALTE